ncbi:hypothetical protein [Aliikangiella sp. IMCC44359]|uniref:hypothetical protein n=1 Tax=Aliikangiella sp. IMCC44359 TaxID=3459125 RepID=UPI00403AF8C9
MKPNYELCTVRELEDICEHIDKDKYPERYQDVLKALSARREKEAIWYADNHPDDETFLFPRRSNKMKIITSIPLLIFTAVCIYFGAIPWRYREELITSENDPILFWFLIILFLAAGIGQILTIKPKNEKSKT